MLCGVEDEAAEVFLLEAIATEEGFYSVSVVLIKENGSELDIKMF